VVGAEKDKLTLRRESQRRPLGGGSPPDFDFPTFCRIGAESFLKAGGYNVVTVQVEEEEGKQDVAPVTDEVAEVDNEVVDFETDDDNYGSEDLDEEDFEIVRRLGLEKCQQIIRGEPTSGVKFVANSHTLREDWYPDNCGDPDEDYITAEPDKVFNDLYEAIQVTFERDESPRRVARVLRKIATMMEGEAGSALVALTENDRGRDKAWRMGDGTVLVSPAGYRLFKKYRSQGDSKSNQ
jgi:hypothetical protein